MTSEGQNERQEDEELGAWGEEQNPPEDVLRVNLDGYEGPLDLLLSLGRAQKLDLMNISILELAEQYLAFIEKMRAHRITLAADYLVMAAWLAFLKSRLLLPAEEQANEPNADAMAAHLAFQLERLAAMRDAGARLMARAQLGMDFFSRGQPEEVAYTKRVQYQDRILDLLQAYARIRTRDSFTPYITQRNQILSLADALANLSDKIDYIPDWQTLWDALPAHWRKDPFMWRSGVASTFTASLELVKQGAISLRQKENFAPIEIKKTEPQL